MKFTGFDMQFYQGSIEELKEIFKDNPSVLSSISELTSFLENVEKDDGSEDSSDKARFILSNLKDKFDKYGPLLNKTGYFKTSEF